MMPGYPYQQGFAVYPGQGAGQPGMPPSAMSYPNIAPTAPTYGHPSFPNVTQQQPWCKYSASNIVCGKKLYK